MMGASDDGLGDGGERSRPLVTMYSKWGCGYCMWARRLLRQKGIDWNEVHVTFRPQNYREMVQRSKGRRTAPQIFIGDYHVGGYRELQQLESRGKLDEILEQARSQA